MNGKHPFSSFVQKDFLASFSSSLPAWVTPLCGLTGAVLFLAGTVCFVAYNWNAWNILAKFALPLAGLLVCAAGAYHIGLERSAGKVFSFACGLFIGLFWVVFGQVYQTGAFVYEFCLAWAVSLVPIALLAGNRWLWLLWAAVGNLYLLSFVDVWMSYTTGVWAVFGFNAACFAVSEWTALRQKQGGWFSLFFLAGALIACLANGVGQWRLSFWLSLGAMVLLTLYAWRWKRGPVQLGFGALAVDILLAERIVSALGEKNSFLTVLSVLFLFVLSAAGVYRGSRQESQNDR